MSAPIPRPRQWPDVDETVASRRVWAAIMLTADVHVCTSIFEGRPVLACQLDAVALRRAIRGQPLPEPDSYFRVRPGHLDAVAECGGFVPKPRKCR
jgi:hypothetical protein